MQLRQCSPPARFPGRAMHGRWDCSKVPPWARPVRLFPRMGAPGETEGRRPAREMEPHRRVTLGWRHLAEQGAPALANRRYVQYSALCPQLVQAPFKPQGRTRAQVSFKDLAIVPDRLDLLV